MSSSDKNHRKARMSNHLGGGRGREVLWSQASTWTLFPVLIGALFLHWMRRRSTPSTCRSWMIDPLAPSLTSIGRISFPGPLKKTSKLGMCAHTVQYTCSIVSPIASLNAHIHTSPRAHFERYHGCLWPGGTWLRKCSNIMNTWEHLTGSKSEIPMRVTHAHQVKYYLVDATFGTAWILRAVAMLREPRAQLDHSGAMGSRRELMRNTCGNQPG